MRADLMVKTGDHCDDSVSRQMAPYSCQRLDGSLCSHGTHRLRADIGVPDLGLKLHDGRAEGILAGYLDVDIEGSALVGCVWRPEELASKVCEVLAIACRLNHDLGELVIVDVGDLLVDTPGAIRGHCGRGRMARWGKG